MTELVPLVALAVSACLALGAGGAALEPRRLVFLALLGLGVLGVLRRGSVPAAAPFGERIARADAQDNPYEALYLARVWSHDSPEGGLEYARRAMRFRLFRTCGEAAAAVEPQSAALAAEARALRKACAEAGSREAPP